MAEMTTPISTTLKFTRPPETGKVPEGWQAFLSPEAAERHRTTGRLTPGDWKSGSEAWLIDLVGPFGGGGDVLQDVKGTMLAGREVRVRGGAGAETV